MGLEGMETLTGDKNWYGLLQVLVRRYGWPEAMAQLEIKEVRVSRQDQSWEILLNAPHPIPEVLVTALEEALRDSFPEVSRIHLRLPAAALLRPAAPAAQVMTETLPEKKSQENVGEQVLLGKKIKPEPVSIQTLNEPGIKTVIQGEIMRLESRTIKSDLELLIMDLTDYTSSVTVKAFLRGDNRAILEGMEEGQWVKVRGETQLDKITQELTLMADDLNKAEPPPGRTDDAAEKRVELHLHTKMSAMDATVDAAAAVALAAAWGHKAVAITDHGVVQAFPEARDAAKKYGIKIIYGMEGYLLGEDEAPETDKERTYHIIILAKDPVGLRNLYRVVSESHLRHFYRHPRIPRSLLAQFREGLIVGSACESGEVYQKVLGGAGDEELLKIMAFYDFIEIQPRANNAFLLREGRVKEGELEEINLRLFRLAKQLGKPVAATGDVHFLNPGDEVYRKILLHGQGYSDAALQPPLYFKTTEEMLEEFAYLGEAEAKEVVVDNPNRIAAEVQEMLPIPDTFNAPHLEGAADQIREMSYREAHRRYGDPLPDLVQRRLDRELNAIINNGFAVLYFIAYKLVKKSMDDGYLVGSRGSVGSSLVATMCGITEVNPLVPHYLCPNCHYTRFFEDKTGISGADLPDANCPRCGHKLLKDGHDIPFETFMGFEGDKVPDIDLNFSGEYQGVVHKYTEQLFGEEHVFRAGTIATLADRTAYGFVKKYLDEHGLKPRSAEVTRFVRGITGIKRTTGQHPGGMMIVPADRDIHEFSPIQYPANDQDAGTMTTHFDYKAISSRLVKLDILGHDDPTVIRMLQDLTGVDPRTASLDDAETMSIFSGTEVLGVTPEQIGTTVGSIGVPEFGTRFVRQMLEQTKPKTFTELVRISGFSHGTDVWLNNAQDLITAGKATLSEAIATRDDIMLFLLAKGLPPKMAFKLMEKVRKGKGLNREDEEEMQKYNIPAWFVESCRKIKYLFPKAHAVAYVTMAFRIAYFKVHYPLAFYATYFTVRADEFDAAWLRYNVEELGKIIKDAEEKGNEATTKEKNVVTILEVLREAKARGIAFLPVDIYASDVRRFLLEDGAIRPPLVGLPGLGTAAGEAVAKARLQGPFQSVEDLRLRTRVSKSVLEIMQEYGVLDGLPEENQMSLFG